MQKGLFITFEGIDGCGKSTQVEYFKSLMQQNNIDFITVREPGGTAISEKIRALLLDPENKEMTDEAEVLLFAAARAQLVRQVILPALNEGKHVLCDRFYDSSIAYQGYGRRIGADFVKNANAYALESCTPDYTLFFDISPEAVRSRVLSRGECDRMENEQAEFHNRVYMGYVELKKSCPGRIIPIDASGSIEEVNRKVLEVWKDIFTDAL